MLTFKHSTRTQKIVRTLTSIALFVGIAVGLAQSIPLVSIVVGNAPGVAGVALTFLSTNLETKSYIGILEYIIGALKKKSQDEKVDQKIKELEFIIDTYNLEKIILLLFKTSEGISNFEGTPLMDFTEESLNLLIKRVSCIRTIHEIRNLIATQCYIGVVGIQDAGNHK